MNTLKFENSIRKLTPRSLSLIHISYVPYEIIGIEDGHEFDLGGGVIVEAVLLPGHTPGQCGYYDRQKHLLFCGDITGIGSRPKGTPYGEFCTVEAMLSLIHISPRRC